MACVCRRNRKGDTICLLYREVSTSPSGVLTRTIKEKRHVADELYESKCCRPFISMTARILSRVSHQYFWVSRHDVNATVTTTQKLSHSPQEWAWTAMGATCAALGPYHREHILFSKESLQKKSCQEAFSCKRTKVVLTYNVTNQNTLCVSLRSNKQDQRISFPLKH